MFKLSLIFALASEVTAQRSGKTQRAGHELMLDSDIVEGAFVQPRADQVTITASDIFDASGNFVIDYAAGEYAAEGDDTDYSGYAVAAITPSADSADPAWTKAETFCEGDDDGGACDGAIITYYDEDDEAYEEFTKDAADGVTIKCNNVKSQAHKGSIFSIEIGDEIVWQDAETYCATYTCPGLQITVKKAKGDKTASFVQAKIDRVGHELMLDFE